MHNLRLRPVGWLAVACTVFGVALFVDIHPALRGGFGWRWPHHPIPLANMVLLAVVLGLYITGGGWLAERTTRGSLWWAFGGSVALALAVAAGQHSDLGYTLFTRTASLVATGPHHAAASLDFTDLDTLQTWTDRIRAYDPEAETISRHVLLAPPGIPLLYDGLNALLAALPAMARPLYRALLPYQCWNYSLLAYTPAEWASAWFGMLMPLWAALTVFPLYGLARRLNVDPALTVLAWGLVPGIASFAGSWNTVYPLLMVSAFYLLHLGLGEDKQLVLVGCGLLYGLGTFLNFAPVPFGLVLGLYALLNEAFTPPAERRWWRPLTAGGWVGLGTVIPWAIWMAFGGASPWAILLASFEIHLDLERAYLPWLFLHTYDWALFAGLPLVVLSAGMATRPRQPAGRVALALWLALGVLVLSGTARAETARVWTFFTPLVVVTAVAVLQRAEQRGSRLAVLASAGVMFFALTSTWDVFDAIDMKPLPTTPQPHATPQAVDARYGEAFSLVGWGAQAESDAITLHLAWQAHQRPVVPYWFSVLWVGPDGQVAPESVIWQGGQTNYPTTCWAAGERVADSVEVPLPAGAPPGDYWLSLAVFAQEAAPTERLPVQLPDGSTDTQLGLGPVVVE